MIMNSEKKKSVHEPSIAAAFEGVDGLQGVENAKIGIIQIRKDPKFDTHAPQSDVTEETHHEQRGKERTEGHRAVPNANLSPDGPRGKHSAAQNAYDDKRHHHMLKRLRALPLDDVEGIILGNVILTTLRGLQFRGSIDAHLGIDIVIGRLLNQVELEEDLTKLAHLLL